MARHGAVEPGLEERGPLVVELVSATFVVLADARNPRVDALKGQKVGLNKEDHVLDETK